MPYERDGLCEIISRNDEGNAKIMRLADGQAKYLIVRYCCAARDSFFLRCVDPVSSELGALKHEEMVAKMLAGVLKLSGGGARKRHKKPTLLGLSSSATTSPTRWTWNTPGRIDPLFGVLWLALADSAHYFGIFWGDRRS